jgi:hypothetical protein
LAVRLRRRLERITRDLEEKVLTEAEACALLERLAAVVRRHVTDAKTLSAIAADLREAIAMGGEGRR